MAREKDIALGNGVVIRPGRKKKHLKVLHTLYKSNSRDISGTFRKIADDIDSGKIAHPNEAAVVLDTVDGKYTVFGFGSHYDSPYTTMGLFQMGLAELRGVFMDVKDKQAESYVPPPKKSS